MVNPITPEERYHRLPPEYGKELSTCSRVQGSVLFAFTALSITAFALFCLGNVTTFPQDFVYLFTHLDPTKLIIGAAATLLLIGGAYWVVHRARSKEDPYVNSQIFLSHNYKEHIEEAVFEFKKEGVFYYGETYIDKSTLKGGNGSAYLYAVKNCGNHYVVSTAVPLATPFYTVCTIAYHAIRTLVIPFWVAANYLVEASLGRPVLGKKERYKLVDIVLEPWKSLKQVVAAPFYSLAFMAAGIYSLINPMGGRVLAAKIERDWNYGATRSEGYWSLGGPQRLWNFGNLELNFFLAGCWQPIGVVEYKKGKIVEGSGKSLGRAVDERKGNVYLVFSRSELKEIFST
ncbi:MAG: hypothetical protein JJU12_02005 [Chlamydiales bacterium]|nr:hypothetical protein [Chlamydiales bacterium]